MHKQQGLGSEQHSAMWRVDSNSASPFDAAVRLSNASDGQGESDEVGYVVQPSGAPKAAGGKHWVVFTSKRPWGNVKPGASAWREAPSGTDTTQQALLWIAAVDADGSISHDASHRAFLFPGQRITYSNTGAAQGAYAEQNNRASWIINECKATGPAAPAPAGVPSECQSTDDCCLGAICVIENGSSPLKKYCRPKPAVCLATGSLGCALDSDCCSSTCVAGKCGGAPVCSIAAASFQRDYQSTCGTSAAASWTDFITESNVPAGTSVRLYLRAADTAAGLSTAAEVLFGTVSVSGALGSVGNRFPVSSAVVASSGKASSKFVRLRMELLPSTATCSSPTLLRWNQLYTCKDNE